MNDDGSAPSETLLLTLYLGNTTPGPGSSGPGTNTKRLLQKHMSEESVKSCVELRFRTAHHNIVLPAVNAGIFTNEIRKCFKRLCKQHDRATAAVLKRRPNFECSELVSAVRSRREIPAEDEAGGRHGRVA